MIKPVVIAAGVVLALGAAAWGFQERFWTAQSTNEGTDMSEVQTDLAMLGRLMALPEPPQSARFEIEELPGGSDWLLKAHLVYDPPTRDAILSPLPASGGEVNLRLPTWLGAGEAPAPDADIRAAEPFVKSPLTMGHVAPSGDTGLYVILFTS